MRTLNSENNPLRVDWLSAAPPDWTGRLGLTIAPGKKGTLNGKTHERDLGADLGAVRDAGADLIVNLMEPDELAHWQMHSYDAEAARLGLDVRRYPIRDMDVPTDSVTFRALVQELSRELRAGNNVVVHCLGGLGRSGTLAACLLVEHGTPPAEARARVRECRPGAVQARQPEFIETYARTRDL